MPSLWLDRAQQLMQLQLHQFTDVQEGDFYFTSEDRETLLVRNKEYFAPPSGNSVSCLNLLRLAELLGEDEYRSRAGRMLDRMTQLLKRYPLGFGYWLWAMDFRLGSVQEIAIVGPGERRRDLLKIHPGTLSSQQSSGRSRDGPGITGQQNPPVGRQNGD